MAYRRVDYEVRSRETTNRRFKETNERPKIDAMPSSTTSNIIFNIFTFTRAPGKEGQKDVAALPIPDYLRVLKRVSSLHFTYITALSKPRWQSSGRLLD